MRAAKASGCTSTAPTAGSFQLTERGRAALAGIERADSITLDPHKGFFLPFGTGCLLVRDADALRAAHSGDDAHYLQDIDAEPSCPTSPTSAPSSPATFRGLRVWLPLHLHGVAAFREALDEKLDLAEWTYTALVAEPALHLYGAPELTTVAFRCADDDARPSCSGGSTPSAGSGSPARGSTGASSAGSPSSTTARTAQGSRRRWPRSAATRAPDQSRRIRCRPQGHDS